VTPPDLFRATHVGSFLRPERLLAAAREARAGTLAAGRFHAVQDESVREVVALQEGLGFRSVTDGEFRRRGWSAGFIDAVDGFGLRESTLGFRDDGGGRRRSRSLGRVLARAESREHGQAREGGGQAAGGEARRAGSSGFARREWRRHRARSRRAPDLDSMAAGRCEKMSAVSICW